MISINDCGFLTFLSSIMGFVHITVLAVFLLQQLALGCNDHKLVVHSIKNCVEHSIVTNKNLSLSMDRNCMATVTGCVVVTKAFKTAKAEFTLKKGILPPIKGDVDACVATTNPKKIIDKLLSTIGFTCPGVKKTVCANPSKKIDISRFKTQIPAAAGRSDIIVEVEHDTGKSCLDVAVEIKK